MKNITMYLAVGVLLMACDQRRDFNLPKGDPEQGRATFILLQCTDCHSVVTVESDPVDGKPVSDVAWLGEGREDPIHVRLGGETTRLKTYADLVTSVVNPSHKLSRPLAPDTMTVDGKSKMRNYNDVMTVQELIDLVAYLQSKYKLWVPEFYTYEPLML